MKLLSFQVIYIAMINMEELCKDDVSTHRTSSPPRKALSRVSADVWQVQRAFSPATQTIPSHVSKQYKYF